MYSQQLKSYIEKVEHLNRLLKADGINLDSYFEAAGLATDCGQSGGSVVGHRISPSTLTTVAKEDEFISSGDGTTYR